MPHHRYLFLYTRVQRDLDAVPKDVKQLIFVMFVYLIGWAIVDPFMAIFIHNISGSYSLAGFIYGLLFLTGVFFAVPVGDLVDKVNKIKYTAVSMSFYPLIGLFYFSVSFLGGGLALIALFFTRVLHGLASLLWIPVEGFIREKSPKGKTSATFGLHVTVHKFSFVLAPLFSIPLILFFGLTSKNIHWLLLVLIPFPIIAVFLVSKIRDEGKPISQGIEEVVVKDGIFRKEFLDLKQMGFIGSFSLLIGFFMRSIEAVVLFLIPLYALSLNFSLVEIALLFAVLNAPYLLSFYLAELADSFGKVNIISIGFVFAAVVLFAISLSAGSMAYIFAGCFALGLILALLQPAVNGLVTDITPRVEEGEMSGIFKAVIKISGFVSALALGLMADAFNLQFPFMVFAVLLLAMAVLTYSIKGKVVVRI